MRYRVVWRDPNCMESVICIETSRLDLAARRFAQVLQRCRPDDRLDMEFLDLGRWWPVRVFGSGPITSGSPWGVC